MESAMTAIHRIPLVLPGGTPEKATTMEQAAPDAIVTENDAAELHVFPADKTKNTGIAAVICPGGGYGVLALGAEGHCCAEWLSSVGITGIVLQYRLPRGNKTVPHNDMQRAMVYARTHADELGIAPDRLGVVGFSAGGHLAAYSSCVYKTKPVSARPDFTVLFYPVISMEKRKRGSTRLNLLGRHPTEQEVAAYSCHLLVGKKTPPALMFHCDDDPSVPTRHSLLYYDALKLQNIPASMHILPQGGHAWGFAGANMDGVPFRYGDSVKTLMLDWITRTAQRANKI